MSRSKKALIPLALGVAMAIGIWLGNGLKSPESEQRNSDWEKIDQILHYVESEYVDDVSRETLEQDAISYLLQRLDPHSHYITEAELAGVNEPLEGSFQGIGVQFKVERDTVYIINTIEGGPSEAAGLRAGDKIIQVDGEIIAGIGLTNTGVMKLLKGESGTKVDVTISRGGQDIAKEIVRGEIALPSIKAAYSINDSIVYVGIDRFAKNTHQEFKDLVYPLKTSQTQHFILDLRGNGGGLLDAAERIADEFLADGLLITYTEGKSRPRKDISATSKGEFEDVELHILIDGYSASASEIIAGAMQDHERAVIYGRRSYGKALVQEQNEWLDGSATRLTVARYFTPNGRNIQREYETLSESSFLDTTNVFDPRGGISPDIEVVRDTAGITWLYADMVHKGLISEYVFNYRDAHLDSLSAMSFEEFNAGYSDSAMIQNLREYLISKSFQINEPQWMRSEQLIRKRIKALLVRNVFKESVYIKVKNESDFVIESVFQRIKNPQSPS